MLGVEGDLSYLNVDGDGPSEFPQGWVTSRGGCYGTLRGRLGYAADRVLFFGTGGLIDGKVGAFDYCGNQFPLLRFNQT